MTARRSGGRAARRAARTAQGEVSKPFLTRRLDPVEVLDEDGLLQIEENAETIMSEVGIAFQDFPEALEMWRSAGAEVNGDLVKFPRGLCRSLVQGIAINPRIPVS